MTDLLPFDTLEAGGEFMSYSAMEAAPGRELQSPDLVGAVESLAAEDARFRIADVEQRFGYQRKAPGLKHGPELLAHRVERINRPVKAWGELDRCNKNGRPANVVREFLLIRLAVAAPNVLDSRATVTAGGKFVRLCAAVFSACGLDTEGLEKSIERVLKSRRTRSLPKPAEEPSSDVGKSGERAL